MTMGSRVSCFGIRLLREYSQRVTKNIFSTSFQYGNLRKVAEVMSEQLKSLKEYYDSSFLVCKLYSILLNIGNCVVCMIDI